MRVEDYEIVTTRSGAKAVLDRQSGEVMHPVVGAAAEARDLYLTPSRLSERLSDARREPLILFDVGLGAGANAGAAWAASEARDHGRRLTIVSFDHTTAALELALQSDAGEALGLGGCAGDAARSLLSTGCARGDRTDWELIPGNLPDTLAAAGPSADIVFWDPYSPQSNPTLWTVAAFRALRERCLPGATVHTYSTSTRVRSALLLAGFAVGRGVAIGSKRETTTAATDIAGLTDPLGRRWLERLSRSSAPWPEDAPAAAMTVIESCPQFRAPRQG